MKIRPPLVAATYFFAALILDRFVSSPAIISPAYRLAGAVISIVSVALVVWAVLVFRDMGTTHEPFGKPTALAVRGPYRFSRNPMYVAVALILLGAAVYIGRAIFFLVPVAFVLTMNFFHISREEELLRSLFGPDYEEYTRRVRRWI